MTSPLFDQSTKFISSECQEWFLERSLLSGERGAAQEWIDKQGAWKANIEVVI